MSNANGIQINNYDRSQLFIWDNRYKKVVYTNPSGSETTLSKGRVMGRVMSTNKVLPQVRTATDGSEMPRFILADDYVVAGNATINVMVCTGGDVDKDLVVWNSGDTQDSVLDEYMTSPATDYDRAGTLGDLLEANSTIKLISAIENTQLDNQ